MKNIINISKRLIGMLYVLAALLLIELCLSSCSEDRLEIQQDFPFEVSVMPVPKDIAKDEYVEIRITILPEGHFSDTHYYLRYFQFEGTGKLQYYNTQLYFPNDTYLLFKKEFRLYYTSTSEVSQSFDIWISDSMGNERKLSFQFNPKNNGIL